MTYTDFNNIRRILAVGTVSLDARREADRQIDSDPRFIDKKTLTPAQHLERLDQRRAIKQAMGLLDARARSMMRLRWGLATGEPMSQREVGRIYGISGQSVHQVEQRATQRLRRWFLACAPEMRPG